MDHWLADANLAGFVPAFTLSQSDSERSHNPPNASVGMVILKKIKQNRYE